MLVYDHTVVVDINGRGVIDSCPGMRSTGKGRSTCSVHTLQIAGTSKKDLNLSDPIPAYRWKQLEETMSDSEGDTTLHEKTRNDEDNGKKDEDSKTKGLAAEIAQQVLAALQSRPGSSTGKYLTPRSTLAGVILHGVGRNNKNSRQ